MINLSPVQIPSGLNVKNSVMQWLEWKIRGGGTVDWGLGSRLWLWAPLL